MSWSRVNTGSPKVGARRLASLALLSGCIVLVATTSVAFASTSSSSPWAPILKGIAKNETVSFSANYKLLETSGGKTTENETITFAQDPSKKEIALVTPSGSIYITSSKTLACRAIGGTETCTVLPASLLASFTAVEDLFAPGSIRSDIETLQGEASSHGYSLSDYSASYPAGGNGYASTCIKVTAAPPKMYGPGIFCTSNSYGVLTYSQGTSSTGKTDMITIGAKSYLSSPPASTFAPPPGATIVTLPKIP